MQFLFLAVVWGALAASPAAGQRHCEVLDLSRTPPSHPLPTDLTVRPWSGEWYLNFELRFGQTPVACVRLKEFKKWSELMLYSGNCEQTNVLYYEYIGYLPHSIQHHTWSTLYLDVTGGAVLVRDRQCGSVMLMSKYFALPLNRLQVAVTGARDAQAMLGCDLGCPMQQFSSLGPGLKKKVGEWHQRKFYFYFQPGPSFSRLHYEVACTAQKDTIVVDNVEIELGEEDAAKDWHQVKLQKSSSKATVHLNDRLLDTIPLPASCSRSRHVIWTVGNGSFALSCTPNNIMSINPASQPDALMHPGVAVMITLAAIGPVVFVACLIERKYIIFPDRASSGCTTK